MKKIIAIVICVVAICACLSGCGKSSLITILLDGGGVSLSESTDSITIKELENQLKEIKHENSDKTLFEDVTISENKGIFYNSYRFMATTKPQESDAELKLTVTMSGIPSGVRNGIIEGKQVVFPISDLSEPMELAAEFEENNIGVIVGIIAVLAVIMASFVFIVKRGGSGGYDSY